MISFSLNDGSLNGKNVLQEMITLTESLVGSNVSKKTSEHKWKNGERCKAIWSKDKQLVPF